MAEKKKKKVTTTTTTTVTEEYVPTNEKTHIVCILDRSGSMSNIMTDSLGGFNAFLKKQKELPDEATITIALFDDKYDLLHEDIDIKKVNELTSEQWYPRGTTALYDAIGKTVNAVKQTYLKLGNEKPEKTLVCIITDGYENASKEYDRDKIKRLIKDCENENWNFIYLGANQDAFAVGNSLNISGNNTYTYTSTSTGVQDMSFAFTNSVSSYRSMNSSHTNFKKMSKSLLNNDDILTKDDNN